MPRIVLSPRSLPPLVILALFAPWDQRVKSQGLLRPAQHFPLVDPGQAIVEMIAVNNGAAVSQGAPLILLGSPDLAFQRESAAARAASLRWQAAAAGVDAKIRQQQQVIEAARGKVQSEIRSIADEQSRYRIKAPFPGRFYLMQPDLHPGAWVTKNERLGILADTSRWQVETYLPESELDRVKLGDKARFLSETPDVADIELRVIHIDRDSHVLPDGMQASSRGGALLVREQNKRTVPEQALYRVTLSPVANYVSDQPQVLRGQVIITGRAKAWSDEYVRALAAFFIRESNF